MGPNHPPGPPARGDHGPTDPRGGSFLAALVASFALFAATASAVSFLVAAGSAGPPVVQPVLFNHQVHVEGEGFACADCHPGCEEGVRPGLPDDETCAMCHSEPIGEGAEERRLVAMIQSGAPLEWQPLFRQPPHIYFSHRRHVTVAGLECAACHGGIGQSQEPPQVLEALRMDDCLDCHRRHGITESCTACHR